MGLFNKKKAVIIIKQNYNFVVFQNKKQEHLCILVFFIFGVILDRLKITMY